jgi:DNA-binding CsgD family transcriptional regulator
LGQAQFAVERMASLRPAAFLNQVQGFLYYQRGDYSAAAGSIERALGTFRSSDPQELLLCLGTLALSLQAAGEDARAQACRDELLALLAQASSGQLAIGSAHSCLALLAVCERDRAKADEYYSLLLPFRGQHHWFLVDRVLGELALDADDPNAARTHLSEAEALAVREHLRPELGRILLDQARLASMDRRPEAVDGAREILRRARITFQDLEMAPGVLQAERRLAELERDGPKPPRRTYAAGLSEREVVVLRLVVSGMSNREIASELALSENTVAKHLTSIFNKAGLDNRAAAAAFAIRNGLA